MPYETSAALVLQVRYLVRDNPHDEDARIFSNNEIDSALVDGFGMVTFGDRDASTATSYDTALAKMYAAANLTYTLVRDKARFLSWTSAAGESVDASKESENLTKLADSWMDQVNQSIKRGIERAKNDVSLTKDAHGGGLNFNPNGTMHRKVDFRGTMGRLNRPSDR